VSNRSDGIAAFLRRHIWYEGVDLGADLLQVRVKAVRSLEDLQGGFLRRHDGQLGFCRHMGSLAASRAA